MLRLANVGQGLNKSFVLRVLKKLFPFYRFMPNKLKN